MVFDVESIGLHGEGFAVAWVVTDAQGARKAEGVAACDPMKAAGRDEDRAWVAANVPPLPQTHDAPRAVREAFWAVWELWRDQGAVLVADCAWPVETNFLSACVRDDPDARTWKGPYPLYDLSSIIMANGGDPLATGSRLPDELPAHDPLADARQSARVLVQSLSRPV